MSPIFSRPKPTATMTQNSRKGFLKLNQVQSFVLLLPSDGGFLTIKNESINVAAEKIEIGSRPTDFDLTINLGIPTDGTIEFNSPTEKEFSVICTSFC